MNRLDKMLVQLERDKNVAKLALIRQHRKALTKLDGKKRNFQPYTQALLEGNIERLNRELELL